MSDQRQVSFACGCVSRQEYQQVPDAWHHVGWDHLCSAHQTAAVGPDPAYILVHHDNANGDAPTVREVSADAGRDDGS